MMYESKHVINKSIIYLRGVIKKFVDWCSEINTYKAMLTDFVGNIKQQMFHQLWKFKLDTLIINHFIIKYILYGIVTRRSLRRVPWRSTTLLLSHVSLYILIHFRSSTQKSNTIFNNLFYMNIKFDKLLSEIDNVLQKGEFKLTKSA